MSSKDFSLIAAAFVVKIGISIDDVLWLTPFISTKTQSIAKRCSFGALYIFVNTLITSGSIGVSIGARSLFYFLVKSNDDFWDAERILGTASSIILFLFAVYLFYEWYDDKYLHTDIDNENENENGEYETIGESKDNDIVMDINDNRELSQSKAHSESEIETETETLLDYDDRKRMQLCKDDINNSDNDNNNDNNNNDSEIDDDNDNDSEGKNSRLTSKRLLFIAIVGSLDQFVVLAVMLLSGSFIWYQIVIGVSFGTILILIMVTVISQIKCIINIVEKIPLWFITLLLSLYTLIDTFVL